MSDIFKQLAALKASVETAISTRVVFDMDQAQQAVDIMNDVFSGHKGGVDIYNNTRKTFRMIKYYYTDAKRIARARRRLTQAGLGCETLVAFPRGGKRDDDTLIIRVPVEFDFRAQDKVGKGVVRTTEPKPIKHAAIKIGKVKSGNGLKSNFNELHHDISNVLASYNVSAPHTTLILNFLTKLKGKK